MLAYLLVAYVEIKALLSSPGKLPDARKQRCPWERKTVAFLDHCTWEFTMKWSYVLE